MTDTAPTPLEGADTVARLIAFMGELSEPLLPARERSDFLVLFSLLSSLALSRRAMPRRRAALCSDGTPIEFSLAVDDRGRHALRFVCDVGAPPAAWDGTDEQWFRELGDKVAPRFDGAAETLDRLFAAHLRDAPTRMPFKVWFGGGASPDAARTGLVYFNTEWLTTPALLAILAPDTGAMYPDWATNVGAGYAGVAYDFDAAGLRKTKLYLRLPTDSVRNLEATLQHFPGGAGPRLLGLFETAFGAIPRGQRGGAMLALGLSAQSSSLDASAYFHLESWGVSDFAGLAPIVERLLGDWGVDPGFGLSGGPSGCAPTLLSLSASGERERLAVYFKPLLMARLVPADAPPAMAAS